MSDPTGAGGSGLPTREERLARVALSQLGEPGDPRIVRLVAELGAPALCDHLIRPQPGADPLQAEVAGRLTRLDPERDLEHAARLGIRFVVPGDEEWPGQVDQLFAADTLDDRGGPPLGLWVRGPLRLDQLVRSVAVVGSRSATTYGTTAAAEIGALVARAGHVVVSGAAFGIDQAAHRGALAAGGQTVAVLACGVDRVYPSAHRQLLQHLGETCAVVSELAPGRAPTRVRFLIRNRIIAALTRGTVVVEAAVRSGALNTAGWAARLHRPLMGVPGPVSSAQSEGVHQLIRSGAAALVTGGHDVMELVSPSGEHLTVRRRGREHSRDRLGPRDSQVLEAVPLRRAVGPESIARTAGMGLLDVDASLHRLQRAGLVERSDGRWRVRSANAVVSPAEAPEVPTMKT